LTVDGTKSEVKDYINEVLHSEGRVKNLYAKEGTKG
jgi:hypothetical protein